MKIFDGGALNAARLVWDLRRGSFSVGYVLASNVMVSILISRKKKALAEHGPFQEYWVDVHPVKRSSITLFTLTVTVVRTDLKAVGRSDMRRTGKRKKSMRELLRQVR